MRRRKAEMIGNEHIVSVIGMDIGLIVNAWRECTRTVVEVLAR